MPGLTLKLPLLAPTQSLFSLTYYRPPLWVFAPHKLFLYSDTPSLVPHSFRFTQAILRRNFNCINNRAISSRLFFLLTLPMKMELTESSETSEHIQTPGNHPKEIIQQSASSYVEVHIYCFAIRVVLYM